MLDLAKGAADVIEGGAAEVLRDLHRPGCAAAIWQRRLPPLFSQWLEALPDGRLPRLRASVPLHGVADLVQAACRAAGTQYRPAGGTGEPEQVQQMQAGWVGLFRGRLWPGYLPCGLLHRSPPIAGSGETGLLLVIDAAQDEDD